MKTEVFPLDTLVEYENNPRENDGTVDYLVMSIQRFGYMVPIVVDENRVVLSGHARLKALRSMGVKDALCVVMDKEKDLNDEYRLLDNLIHDLTSWDGDTFKVELRGLDYVTDVFPELGLGDAPSLDVGTLKVDDGAVAFTEKKLEEKFKEKSDQYFENLVSVRCPNCGEEYEVLRSDLER